MSVGSGMEVGTWCNIYKDVGGRWFLTGGLEEVRLLAMGCMGGEHRPQGRSLGPWEVALRAGGLLGGRGLPGSDGGRMGQRESLNCDMIDKGLGKPTELQKWSALWGCPLHWPDQRGAVTSVRPWWPGLSELHRTSYILAALLKVGKGSNGFVTICSYYYLLFLRKPRFREVKWPEGRHLLVSCRRVFKPWPTNDKSIVLSAAHLFNQYLPWCVSREVGAVRTWGHLRDLFYLRRKCCFSYSLLIF